MNIYLEWIFKVSIALVFLALAWEFVSIYIRQTRG